MMSQKEKMKKNTIRLGIWTFLWLLGSFVSSFGPKLFWSEPLITISSVIITILIGAFVIRANVQYLNDLDELQRKIQLEAFSWSFGVAIVVGLGYAQLGTYDILSEDGQIPILVVIMSVSYLIAMFVGKYRYR